jgi:DNA processing protein
MDKEALRYLIALTLIPAVGSITARKLIAYTGSAKAVFSEKKSNLQKIPGIGSFLAGSINPLQVLGQADRELLFIEKNSIKVLTIIEKDYPERLKQCADAPLVLYLKGKNVLNAPKVLSIVGTRNATEYGIEQCRKIIRDLTENNHQVLIVSGLAYGVDAQAHMAALQYGQETIAVLAHGLHTLYPNAHKNLASRITENGALLTDFGVGDNPERNNFLKRNRIIAGLADATLVVESGKKGGALITADLAISYNRDVFAVPGRANDTMSDGCNRLIRDNKAALVQGFADIEYLLGWDIKEKTNQPRQARLFVELSGDELKIVEELKKEDRLSPDILSLRTGMPVSKISATLLKMEFKALVSVLPGNYYRLL